MKKLICVALALVMILSFVACSKPIEKETTTQNSTTAPTGRIYYDKYGNGFDSLEKLPFYDKNENKYYLENQTEQIFADEDGNQLDGNRCFVDTHGVFIYDEKNEIELIDSLSAQDKNGKLYYPAATVRWTDDNKMINAFGFGQEVIPD